jgi:hypothetical protein
MAKRHPFIPGSAEAPEQWRLRLSQAELRLTEGSETP